MNRDGNSASSHASTSGTLCSMSRARGDILQPLVGIDDMLIRVRHVVEEDRLGTWTVRYVAAVQPGL